MTGLKERVICHLSPLLILQVAQMVKNLPAMQDTRVQSLGQEDPLEKDIAKPTPVFLPGEFYAQRSLAGYSPRGHKESDITERLTLSFFLMPEATHYPPVMPPLAWGTRHCFLLQGFENSGVSIRNRLAQLLACLLLSYIVSQFICHFPRVAFPHHPPKVELSGLPWCSSG